MRKFQFWAIIISTIFISTKVQAQIENLIVSSVINQDTIEFTIENPDPTNVSFSYVVLQDQILYVAQGDTTLVPNDMMSLRIHSDSIYYRDFDLELSSNQSSSSNPSTPEHFYSLDEQESKVVNKQSIVYPNPAREKVSILLPKGINSAFRLKLFDMNGILKADYNNIDSGSFILPRKELESGVYILQISGGDLREYHKVYFN